jgi:hypothetical protein
VEEGKKDWRDALDALHRLRFRVAAKAAGVM